jgi:ACS family glucarate transporter-like MFS transporter
MRYLMILLATLVAVLLYLDRICISTAGESVEKDLGMTRDQLNYLLGAFFWSDALGQLPAGNDDLWRGRSSDRRHFCGLFQGLA